MIRSRQQALGRWLLLLTFFTVSNGCGTIIGNPEEDEEDDTTKPLALAELPDLSGIYLGDLGKSSGSGLTTLAACDATDDLGIFGVALGGACVTATFVGSILYGENPDVNGDDVVDCTDYDTNPKERGILFPLLCEKSIQSLTDVVSLRFPMDEGGEAAIDFTKYNDGIGKWNARGPDEGRYPADIRVWSRKPEAEVLSGLVSIELETARKGLVYFSLPDETTGERALFGDSTFSSLEVDDATECKANPSKETCHSQEIRMVGELNKLTSFRGYHVIVYADQKEKPTFLAIEGKMTYTPEQAATSFGEPDMPEAFKTVRTVYFRTIQTGSELWGSFDFKNEAGETIEAVASGFNVPQVARNGFGNVDYAGICQKLGSDQWVDCGLIDYQDYAKLWIGDADLSAIDETYTQPVSYDTPPEKAFCRYVAEDVRCD